MVNKPKNIGTAGESAVVRWLNANGWPYAERRALKGTLDCGDITGTPLICWEVKAGQAAKTASDGQVALWLEETEKERVNAKADIGILVMARAGIGPANAGRWWAVLPMLHLSALIQGIPFKNSTSPLDRDDVQPWLRAPVRLQLAGIAEMLRRAGYGDEISEWENAS